MSVVGITENISVIFFAVISRSGVNLTRTRPKLRIQTLVSSGVMATPTAELVDKETLITWLQKRKKRKQSAFRNKVSLFIYFFSDLSQIKISF